MPNAIDHLILALTPDEHVAFVETLTSAGFVDKGLGIPAKGMSDEIASSEGLTNQYLAFRGGAFIELLSMKNVDAEHEVWFDETPRIQGLGFTTDVYDEQTAPWAELPNSWNAPFIKTLKDGSTAEFWAAGPLPHHAKFYPFVMKRPIAQYPDVESEVVLRSVVFAGQNSSWWRERISKWFNLTPAGGDFTTDDDVTISFVDGPHDDVRLSLTFDVPGESLSIPISGGTIDLIGPAGK